MLLSSRKYKRYISLLYLKCKGGYDFGCLFCG